MHCTCRSLLTGAFGGALHRATTAPPAFLLPTLAAPITASFTTSAPLAKRLRGRLRPDGNPWRGISALRRTGMPTTLGRFRYRARDLPQPVLDPALRSAVEVDEDHGLWGFFNEQRETLTNPVRVVEHGRAWTAAELRRKSWEDLHSLWWVCTKERNRMATEARERSRLGDMYGDAEDNDRRAEIKKTMKAIKFVLSERYYAWQDARQLAMGDEEVNLFAQVTRGESVYVPKGRDLSREPLPPADDSAQPPIDESADDQPQHGVGGSRTGPHGMLP